MQLAKKSDYIGMLIGSLCFLHCVATPFIFIVQTCSKTCCVETPIWWQLIDYVFLIVSFAAIWYSVKNSHKKWVKIALWLNWILLAAVIIYEEKAVQILFDNIIFLPAITLIVLHLYNKMFCCGKKKQNTGTSQNCNC